MKQTFEVDFIDSDSEFPEQLIGECIISGKHLIGRIKVTEVSKIEALTNYQAKLTNKGVLCLKNNKEPL